MYVRASAVASLILASGQMSPQMLVIILYMKWQNKSICNIFIFTTEKLFLKQYLEITAII